MLILLVISDAIESALLMFNFLSAPFNLSLDRTSLLINVIEVLSKRTFILIFFILLLRITGMICSRANLLQKKL